MAGLKTNERPGTRAVLRHARISSYKVREVLDLVRGRPVHEAEDILRFSERDAAQVVGKVLHSAVSNAEHNDQQDPEELFVAACFADEGTTIKRWRPRARGRATRIRKRTSHITVIVSRMPDEELQRMQARRRAEQLAQRARRVAGARQASGDARNRAERRRRGGAPVEETLEDAEATSPDETAADTTVTDEVDAEEVDADEVETDEVETDEVDAEEVDADEDGTSEDVETEDEAPSSGPDDEASAEVGDEDGPEAVVEGPDPNAEETDPVDEVADRGSADRRRLSGDDEDREA
jgi:large subunit ribosomal protein L22